jgi:hypothetical protein
VFSYYSDATAGLNQLYLRTPVQASPTDNGTTDPLLAAFVLLTPVTLTSYPTDLCDQGGGSNNVMAPGGDGEINAFDLENNSIYNSLIAKATLSESEAVMLHDLLVYQTMNSLRNNIELATELNPFEAEARVELSLQESALSEALSYTEAMNTDFMASLIQQQVNRLRIANRQSIEWVPTEKELTNLNSIANLCPKQYGRAVKQARSILANYLHEIVEYENDCVDYIQNAERNAFTNTFQIQAKNIIVSPNPISIENQDLTITLLFSGTVKLFSLNSGIELQSWQLEAGKNVIKLNGDLKPGIYGVTLFDTNNKVSTQKVVIQP